MAVHRPFVPEPSSPLKSRVRPEVGRVVKASAPCAAGWVSLSAPPGAKLHERARVPAGGQLAQECSQALTGLPGSLPAPLSNSTRTEGSASKAASASA